MNERWAETDETGYLSAPGFEAQLRESLRRAGLAWREHGRLFLADSAGRAMPWAQNTWYAPQRTEIASIKDAARALRDRQRNWATYAPLEHRRARLIQEQLPHVSARPLVFPSPAPSAPLGSWTLLDRDTLLAAPHCASPFPHGEAAFIENKKDPPNRAYLKLWEALTLYGGWPQPGELCLDLGSAPGGWSWALAELSAYVISVDKAPLDPKIAQLPAIQHRTASAFGLDPRATGPVDWLFSDVICYPARLLRLVESWVEADAARRIICTLKFQGETDFDAIDGFTRIKGGRLIHLSHNKHELTWLWSAGHG